MRILIVGENLSDYLAKCHEALRTGLRRVHHATAYGKGYPGHKPSLGTYEEILREIFPEKHPELLIADFSLSSHPREWGFPYEGLDRVNVPKAIVLGDFWNVTESDPEAFLRFLEHYDIGTVFCYFPAAVRFFAKTRLASRFQPLLPCFDPEIFNDWRMDKAYDVGFLAAGTSEYTDFYPERFHIHQKLLQKEGIKYLWGAHPGWQRHAAEHPLVGTGFSRAINSCRLFITTAGKYRHPNPKYLEILASRTVLLAETPEDAELLGLQDGVNYVGISQENVLERVDYYLARPELCEQIAESGQRLALQHHNCYVRAIELEDLIAPPAQPAASPKRVPLRPKGRLNRRNDSQAPAHSGKTFRSENGLALPQALVLDQNQPEPIRLPPGMSDLPISSSPQYTLYRLVRYLKPKSILEIGSQHGCSAVAMALAMRDNQTAVDITCIDPFLPSGDNDGLPTLENWYRHISAFGYLRDIVLHVTTSDKILTSLNREFDFVLVDGSHEYKDVKYDFENVLPLVNDGGYIWLHDYMTYESVRTACNEVVQQYNLPYAINPLQRNYRNDLCGWMIARKPLIGTGSELSRKRRVMVLYDPHLGHVTAQARGLSLRESLGKLGWEAEYVDIRRVGEDEIIAGVSTCDAVYLLKVASLSLVKRLKQTQTPVVFDLADALWKEHHRNAGWHDLDAILTLADALTSDNPYVAEYGRRFNKPITIVPMATQIEKIDRLRDQASPKPGGRLRIGWIGSQGTAGAIANLHPVLQRLAECHPDLELRVLGADQQTLPHFPNLEVSTLNPYTEDDMIRELLQMDIGIHPIAIDLEDYVVRGGMKAFLYMSAGVPPVCQNAGECADVIQNGLTGMLASNEAEWFEKLDVLIRSSEMRRSLGRQAIAAIRNDHTLDAVAGRLGEALEAAIRSVPRERAGMRPTGLNPHRLRVLLIADVPNWIFDRHCKTLHRYLSNEFEFSIAYGGQPYREDEFDLIYPLEWNLVRAEQVRTPLKYVTGIRSHLFWPKLDFSSFVSYLANHFQQVHVVSRRLLNVFSPALPGVVYVTHGVDTGFFKASTRTDQSGQRVRIGWAGNPKSATDKGFATIIEPLGQLPGVDLIHCGYGDRQLPMEQMRSFYDLLDVYICASDYEGSNNSLLEAAAMERAIITTDNGTVPEYLRNGQSAFIVERDFKSFAEALVCLQKAPGRRLEMGRRARAALVAGWDWSVKAEEYRAFFRNALERARILGATRPGPATTSSERTSSPQPAELQVLLERSRQALARHDRETGLTLLRLCVQRYPAHPDAYRMLSDLLEQKGEHEAGRNLLALASKIASGELESPERQA